MTEEHQEEANGDCDEVDVACLVRWEDVVRDDDLEHSKAVCNVVCCAVAEKEEAAGADLGEVVSCRGPEFEEVEETERCNESEKAPDGVSFPCCFCADD